MQTENYKKVALMIHDLTPWGGQDRSCLEIAWNLNKNHPLEVHSYQLVGYENWPNLTHVPYKAKIKKPIIFKYLHYYQDSKKKLKGHKNDLVQSTGTACLVSDIVQVQFIHHTWLQLRSSLDLGDTTPSRLDKKAYHYFLNKFKIAMERKLYTKQKHYIAISESIKNELIEHFNIPPENIDVVHHGVNPEHFHPPGDQPTSSDTRTRLRKKLGLSENKTVLLHVGAINERKGIHHALKTFHSLCESGLEDIHYLAVGQGDPKPYMEWCRRHGIEDRVTFVSHCKDIRDYYWAADIFFFPSLYEPFGLVILEAMSCGLPSVVSKSAGASELIKNHISGITIPDPTDSSSMFSLMTPLLKDKDLQQRMAQEARAIAINHSWDLVAQRYSDVYQKLT